MADSLHLRRNAQNEYRIPVRVEGISVDALIDTGMTSPDCLIGVGLDSERFMAVAPSLRGFRRTEMVGVGHEATRLVIMGLGRISIEGLDGSEVESYVAEVGDNLLGVCYFQRLTGFEIVWEPDAGQMTITKKPPRVQ